MGSIVKQVAGTVISLAGGLLGGGKSADASKGTAEALRAATDRASGMAAFTPYGMTTGFGTSTFADGKGSYALSPELQAIQNRLFGAAGSYDPTQVGTAAQPIYGGASSLFNLGQQYLAKSPEQAAQEYMAQQQGLLAPGREAAQARLGTTNFGRGTGGLAVNTGTGGAPSNPAAQALYNAQARQDLELAAQADKYGMERTRFGAGLFGTGGDLLGQIPKITTAGYGPLEAQLGLLKTTEAMGQDPYKMSIDLANQYAQAGARQGQLYLQPQAAAAQAYSQYQGYSPIGSALGSIGSTVSSMGGGAGGVGSWFSDLIGPSAAPMYSGSSNFYGGASPTMSQGRLSSSEANAGGGFGY
jgi:hypothetical protein